MAHQLSLQSRAFIWMVIVGGIGAGLWLVARSSITAADWPPSLVFGAMAALATAASISYRGPQPSSVTYQIMTAFAYSAFLLVDPAAVCGVLWLTTLADKFVNRRQWLKTAFNIGQMTLAVASAHLVRGWIAPQFDMALLDATTLGAATASICAFALVNHGLIQIVVSLADRRRLFRWSFGLRTGTLLEFFCILSGVSMAVLWGIEPWLAALGAIPTWTMFFLVQMLSRRENALQAREVELHSLQNLGLEMGAVLDIDHLRSTVLRIACEALDADRALLAAHPDDRPSTASRQAPLRVVAHKNFATGSAEILALVDRDNGVFNTSRIQHFVPSREHTPDALADCDGALVAPIEVRGRGAGVLVLTHGPRRRAFDDDDVRRLESLMRFVNFAFSNADMVVELKDVHERLAHTEKMSALGMLISGVAHELNNPLTSVLGYAELLRDGEVSPRRGKMLDTIGREARRAGKIVNNLLTFSRKRKPSKRLVAINEIVKDVLEFRAYEQSVVNICVVEDLAGDLPPILADPHQLHQVFLNLVTNAEQAISEAGRPGRITIRTERREGTIRVLVGDDGPGIHPDHLKQVFVPFFTTKEVGRGTGLGLSICYGIVHEHGGTIEVQSREGNGSIFTVELPVADAIPAVPPPDPTAASPVAAVVEGRGRLLVVDDEPDIVELVTLYFESLGWQVSSATDGRKALEVLESRTFDALIVDLRMPGMDGAEFYRTLARSRPELAARVVFATGDVGDTDSARFIEQTGAELVHKPFDLQTLERVVSGRIPSTAGVADVEAGPRDRTGP